ncbi:tRNA pseudouridine(38-40) synthase TruA [Schaalia suimastitidis]|uniref:tRNA pseudouridine(38-40) synthase TruA n=1 Tax=Schaalia suimastitidis TaxID=121163 RepID=UPI0003FDF0B4|nr:tRNA pseudouridine(38-40) synthase TruA [Schaalia suimastitidis]
MDNVASSPDVLRIKFTLAYDGTYFRGWAAQPGQRTCQGELETALATLARQPLAVTVAGRTDAGVHARHQCAHVDLPSNVWDGLVREETTPPNDERRLVALVRRLNGLIARRYGEWMREHGLPSVKGAADLLVLEAQVVNSDFDARFAASGRAYIYRVGVGMADPMRRHAVLWMNDTLKIGPMRHAARTLLGEHDFLSYCRPRQGATTIRTLRRLDVLEDSNGEISFHVEADAFCHSMVRSLVGALLEVGCGRREADWPRQLLEACSREAAAPIAPAHGLTLDRVDYPAPHAWGERVAQAKRRRDADNCGC